MTRTGLLTIDLNAIRANWCYLNSVSGNQVETAAVVKANAYGVGALKVAQALYLEGCRTYFLATQTEAFSLADDLPPDSRFIILSGVYETPEKEFTDPRFIPVLSTYKAVVNWASFSSEVGEPLPCVVKVNTGMNRMGLDLPELNSLLLDYASNPFFSPMMLMSHLACADDVYHQLNSTQLKRFHVALDLVRKYFPAISASLANSSGIFLGANWHFDLVRPGAALYGVKPNGVAPNPLKQPIRLKLPVMQVRRLNESACVGYSATVEKPAGTRLIVVAGGYADGLNRVLGANPLSQLKGCTLKSVGRMSMDSMVFDATDVQCTDEDLLNDYVEVINENFSLDYLMQKNQSLGYEVLTSLGSRFQREYLG